ncbi:unnamed protein product [Mesocestoides corti]|uniref:Uncharacterized protein n=1 Tax=Mesocestoides corti TaxID=53468 RepID=A0A0R3UDQ5_MESCO|nr:unnamed protein product [Mesocestoides corti]
MQCCVSFRGTTFTGKCYVFKANLNLHGLDWFEQLGLADIPISSVCNALHLPTKVGENTADIINQFTTVFQPESGHCSTTQATFRLMPDAKPVFRPKRPVPYASLPLVDAELERLEHEGVLWKGRPLCLVQRVRGGLLSTQINAQFGPAADPL